MSFNSLFSENGVLYLALYQISKNYIISGDLQWFTDNT